jgi:hypothetical protein
MRLIFRAIEQEPLPAFNTTHRAVGEHWLFSY